MLENDYIIKQIDILINFLAKVLFKKDSAQFHNIKDENGNITDTGQLYLKLHDLTDNGQINDAEDLLFSEIEKEQRLDYLELAVDFYNYLNEKDDDFLEEYDFSRQEIFDGMKDIQKIYGLDDV
ncbi:MAG: DUF6483 family protein [Ruminococcus sp.]